MNSFDLGFLPLLKIFVYIQTNLKMFGFSVFRFDLFDKLNGYLVSLKYSVNLASVLNTDNKGKIKFIAVAH